MKPTRVDGMLADARTACTVRSTSTKGVNGVPGHKMTAAALDLKAARKTVFPVHKLLDPQPQGRKMQI